MLLVDVFKGFNKQVEQYRQNFPYLQVGDVIQHKWGKDKELGIILSYCSYEKILVLTKNMKLKFWKHDFVSPL